MFLLACVPPSQEEKPQVHIEPALPTTADELKVVFDLGDASADWTIRWFRDDDWVDGLDQGTVSAHETTKEETWHVVVGSGDGFNSFVEGQAEVTIVNSAPEVTVSVSPEAPLATEDVTALPEATDADGDALALSYAWKRTSDGQVLESQTLSQNWTGRGDEWTVTVIASDGTVDGAPATASVSVENSVPRVQSAQIVPGVYTVESTLSVELDLVDDDGDEVTAEIEWLADGVVIQDGTSTEVAGSLTTKHQQVQARITPQDGFIEGDPVLSNTIEISNSAPEIDIDDWVPAALFEESTADCTPDPARVSDADGDSVTFGFAWWADGVDLGVSTATLDGASFDKDQEIECKLTPSDPEEEGGVQVVDFDKVQNSPPTVTGVSLAPVSPTIQDVLTATPSGLEDPDPADTPSMSYHWTVGSGSSASAGSTLTLASFSKGDVVQVTAEATDGEDTSAPVADQVTIQNSLPTIDNFSLSHTELGTEESLQVLSTSTRDADGDSVSIDWDWTVNGQPVSETGTALSGFSWFDRGDTLQVTGTPFDGEDSGSPLASSPVSVVNTPPTAPLAAVMIMEDPFFVPPSEELVCGVMNQSTDADGDPVTYSFSWTQDGVPYTGSVTETAVQSSIAGSEFWPGEQWVCTVTPSDGLEDGTPGSTHLEIPLPCGALNFSSANGYPQATDFPPISGDATLEIWFYANSLAAMDLPTYGPVLLDTADSTLQICSGGTAISVWENGFGSGGNCSDDLNTGVWQHLAVVHDATAGEVLAYLDGSAVARQWSAPMTFGASGPFTLGAMIPGDTNQFDGLIGEIRVWNRALSQSELQQNMTLWLDSTQETDLVGHWPFAEGGGNTAHDQTTGGQNFLLSDDTLWTTTECPY